MALVTNGLIEASDYDAIALKINRIFSDISDGAGGPAALTFTSNKILDTVVNDTGTNQTFSLTGNVFSDSYLVVDVNGQTLLPTQFSINPGQDQITVLISITTGSQIRAFDRSTHIYGWGQTASVYPHPTLAGGASRADASVLEANVNNLIDKVNIMTERVGSVVELTRVAPRQVIRASDLSTVVTTVDNEVDTGTTPWTNNIATVESAIATSQRTDPWSIQLLGVCTWVFSSYNDARYFFNSGSEIRANVSLTGDPSDAGYANWSQVTNQMGSLIIDWQTTRQTGSGGISNGIGFYGLTETWQTIFTSASPANPFGGDGSVPGEYPSEYVGVGEYSNLFIRWDARWSTSSGNHTVEVRMIMDDSTFTNQDIAGTASYNGGWKLADQITNNSATFSITTPSVVHTDSLNSANDS